jgi:hypothetical protein
MPFHTDDFIEDGPAVDTHYMPWRHSAADTVENSRRQVGRIGLFASIEERYSSESGPTHRIAEGKDNNELPLESNPTIATTITNITRMPAKDNYPLWQVRCKVKLFATISHSLALSFV